MKAVQILGDRGDHRIALSEHLPRPKPSDHEVLVRIEAAGVTADETSWVEVYKTPSRIPGHDISGFIVQLPMHYAGPIAVGTPVFAMLHADRGQGMADYATVRFEEMTPKPRSLTHAQAAAMPIPAVTAWEALHQHARLGRGRRVLVTGASGAVGRMIVQLARVLFDAEVVALASVRNHALLRDLGAAEVVDYNTPGWEGLVKDVDAVFDTAGGEVLTKSWQTVKGDAVIVTVADPPPPWAFGGQVPEELKDHPGVRYVYFVLSPDAEALRKVAGLIDEGKVQALPVVEFPVDSAVEAWEFAATRSRGGKVVITFGDGAENYIPTRRGF
ncbi:putative zinc-containing alcohol dehydrogenase [Lasiosphaeris hirsuta]|uniref:Zinc-containing alcohol dehydrogenase n=1 Tax=Lasiosphaeris hirsuta TaxID=260670 RepID=A0AA40DXR7_9PEZI|nr:putative zinc-containing alcohol dehydrogenase [Lasiosphaeris hirsuta]